MPAGPGHCPVAVAQVLGVAGASRSSTQARAMSESLDLVPGRTAKPLFSTTVVRSQVLALASSAILTGASPWARKRSAQNGARAITVALCAATPASLRAVAPVTQPPQVKPRMAQAAAPITAPQIIGLVSLGMFMASPIGRAGRRSRRRAQDREAGNQQNQEDREQDGGYEPVSHVWYSAGAGAHASLSHRKPRACWAMVATVVHSWCRRVQAIRYGRPGCSIRHGSLQV